MNRDQLHSVREGAQVLREQVFRVIDRTQHQPSTQLLAMALALTATCEALDVDVRDLLVTCERMKNDLDGPFIGMFRGIEEYARNELGRK